ncbi:hypothetical protein AKO1_008126 [Acrasis kona]|uniref:ATP-dependent protease subunit HslV n=1 Tax=Acrasis kona TaxID=1008807 RepID=A0AAW2YPM8_9EUKA
MLKLCRGTSSQIVRSLGLTSNVMLSNKINLQTPKTQNRSFHANTSFKFKEMHGTTVLCVRKNNQVALVADGQVTQGHCVVKGNARKLRTIGNKVIAGFAGSTADAIALFEKLEQKIDAHPGQLKRACVNLAKEWRTDKYLRKLDAVLVVADKDESLLISGTGDVLEPPTGVLGIGSGGEYAVAAATALMEFEQLSAEDVANRAMKIAADICIYTNSNFTRLNIRNDGLIEQNETYPVITPVE